MSVVDYQEAINNLLIFNVCRYLVFIEARKESSVKNVKIMTVMRGPDV